MTPGRKEHLRADAALAEDRTVPLIPPVARELTGDFWRSLANQGILHPLDAEALCRWLGVFDARGAASRRRVGRSR